MQKDKESEELRLQGDIAELTEKLETANYRILELSSNEEKIKVYQQRLEKMAQTQHDLNDYQHRTAALLDEV